jgi:hypothetical protein
MTTYDAVKLIKIIDPQAGTLRESVLEAPPVNPNPILEVKAPNGRRMSLREVAENNLSIFPTLLRSGLRAIMFDSYAGVPQTWQLWAQTIQSDKLYEDWLEESAIGLLPPVGEGAPYPHLLQELDRTFQIANQKRGAIISVTEEMIAFNKVGVITQQAQALGQAMARTKEQDAYNIITTAGNYNRNSTTGDNDFGANTAATTFGPSGLAETIFPTLTSMKDRKSGAYLGVRPNTIIVGPALEYAAKQLLLSPVLSGMGDADATVSYGTGTSNPFRGAIDTIIVAPQIQSFSFVVMERGRAVVCQEVWPLQLLQGTMTADNSEYFNFDVIEYRARELYGFGMLNDRYAYYSSSTTAPTID